MKAAITLFAVALAIAGMATVLATADKSMVGQQLPPLKLDYISAKPALTGKPMVLEFWATWCPPCRQSIPHLNAIYTKYKAQGLVIVGVTTENKKVVTDFLQKTPMSYFPALDAGGELNRSFAITGIPHAVLVNKSGKIIWEGHPMSLDEKQIAAVLK
jgi:thiol-disulfide isomerase/thioredoxin